MLTLAMAPHIHACSDPGCKSKRYVGGCSQGGVHHVLYIALFGEDTTITLVEGLSAASPLAWGLHQGSRVLVVLGTISSSDKQQQCMFDPMPISYSHIDMLVRRDTMQRDVTRLLSTTHTTGRKQRGRSFRGN